MSDLFFFFFLQQDTKCVQVILNLSTFLMYELDAQISAIVGFFKIIFFVLATQQVAGLV